MLRRVVSSIPVEPSLEAFAELAKRGNVVPVYTQLAADFETPLSAYLKLRDSRHSFLLESAESTEKGGRWSIIGSDPRRVFEARGKEITIREGSQTRVYTTPTTCSPRWNAKWPPTNRSPTARCRLFSGGMVGYLSYDAVRQFEPHARPAAAGPARHSGRDVSVGGHAARLRSPPAPPASHRQRLHRRVFPHPPTPMPRPAAKSPPSWKSSTARCTSRRSTAC